jgi:nitroimidazol reductase NimA-like FMN-containing flavoprotein (pyridoxamine 5'-phosphate oxidase superfamily)
MGRLLPAPEALEFSVEYSSVAVFGTGRLVEDPEEAEHGLQLIMRKYAPHLQPGPDYRPMTPEEVKRTAVLRIDIEAWSGKEKAVEEEVPGAYRFEDVRRPSPSE